MLKDIEKTKVIFRTFKGEVTAIFPEECGDNNYGTCMSYQHFGQHGSCDPNMIIDNSKLSTPEEYNDLKNELENQVGYNLEVIKRYRYKFTQVRFNKLNDQLGEHKYYN
jgi:hypothetical protein